MKEDLLDRARRLAEGARRKLAEDRKQLEKIRAAKTETKRVAAQPR